MPTPLPTRFPPSSPVGEHAVVLGASMAGLLAARVLAGAFRHVTVVERDTLPSGAEDRRGVPQGRQVHALLARGGQVIDELFPDMSERLAADGAVLADGVGSIRFQLGGRRLRNAPTGARDVFCSRLFLEQHVRDAVRALPTVTLRDGCDVLGPVAGGDRVTGVRIRATGAAPRTEQLAADLVVDATGRGSRTPVWLAEMGRTAPPESRVVVDTGYVGGRFRLRPGALGDDIAILTSSAPGNPRSGALFTVEHGDCVAGVAGTLGDHPPTDLAGFLGFARTLAFGDLAEALEGAELRTPLRAARFPANLRRHYERLPDPPAGLLVLGDALCAFNPIYGQGMTVAAMEADALRRLLDRGRVPAPREYFRAAARTLAPAWDLATGADLQDPRVEGPRSRGARLINGYVDRLQAAAVHDATLSRAFLDVSGLLAPPPSLMRPDRVARVVWSGLRHRRAPARPLASTV